MAARRLGKSSSSASKSELNALIERSQLRPRTKQLYRECVTAFVAYAGDDPNRYTPGLVEDWLYELSKMRQPQTVNVYRKAVRFASRRWAKHGGDNFAADVDRLKVISKPERISLTYEEAWQLLATCDADSPEDVRDRALMATALRTGLRRGGLLAMTIENIQPPHITTVNKGGAALKIKPDAEVFADLEAWLAILRNAGYTHGPVFRQIGDDGIAAIMTPFQVWYVFKRRAAKAEIRHVFPHLARHTTVMWLRNAGVLPMYISTLTGQSERTIEDIYTRAQPNDAVGSVLPSLRGNRRP